MTWPPQSVNTASTPTARSARAARRPPSIAPPPSICVTAASASRRPGRILRRGCVAPGDETRASAAGEVAERPAHEDDHPILEPDQVQEIYEQPQDPGWKAGQAHALQLRHRAGAPDRREAALVPIAEWPGGRVTAEARSDRGGDVASLLHR